MRLSRVALVAAILLVPSVTVGVVLHRSQGTTKPDVSPPAATEAVEVTARLAPYRNVVFPEPADRSAAPAATCDSAMAAMQALGGVPALFGRLEVTFRATRPVQLRIDEITVETVRRESRQLASVAGCIDAVPPVVHPGDPDFNEQFDFGPDSYFTPVIRLADQFTGTAPAVTVPSSGPTPIDEMTFDFRRGSVGTIPVYLLTSGGPSFRTGFQVTVDLTVNGVSHHRTLTDAANPFWIYQANFRQGDGPIFQWSELTKTWQTF
ncbi:hypothetical protein [Actinoplanes sp. M2I2]|uniref:hypothetical protein n=1 Tax=Actinoplanes sp. M2I2 TaxID=1734444 RepID=UPI0020221B97|nr:hypothetical protein [Actinoplanes sp. M2I2]